MSRFRAASEYNAFHLGRIAGLGEKSATENCFDREKQFEAYCYWLEGWRFGCSELEDMENEK